MWIFKKSVEIKIEYASVDEDLHAFSTDYSIMFTNENYIMPFIFDFTYFA